MPLVMFYVLNYKYFQIEISLCFIPSVCCELGFGCHVFYLSLISLVYFFCEALQEQQLSIDSEKHAKLLKHDSEQKTDNDTAKKRK